MATTTSTSWSTAALRAELLGQAVADPERLIDALVAALEPHPAIGQQFVRSLLAGRTTRLAARDLPEPPPATPDRVAFIRSQLEVFILSEPIIHPTPLVFESFELGLGAEMGEEGAILGGVVVNLHQLARLVPANDLAVLDRVSEAIAAQLGSRLSKRTMTQPADIRVRPARRRLSLESESPEEEHHQIALFIQGFWEKGADVPRGQKESQVAYTRRLYQALLEARTASTGGDEVVQAVQDRFPVTKTWQAGT